MCGLFDVAFLSLASASPFPLPSFPSPLQPCASPPSLHTGRRILRTPGLLRCPPRMGHTRLLLMPRRAPGLPRSPGHGPPTGTPARNSHRCLGRRARFARTPSQHGGRYRDTVGRDRGENENSRQDFCYKPSRHLSATIRTACCHLCARADPACGGLCSCRRPGQLACIHHGRRRVCSSRYLGCSVGRARATTASRGRAEVCKPIIEAALLDL